MNRTTNNNYQNQIFTRFTVISWKYCLIIISTELCDGNLTTDCAKCLCLWSTCCTRIPVRNVRKRRTYKTVPFTLASNNVDFKPHETFVVFAFHCVYFHVWFVRLPTKNDENETRKMPFAWNCLPLGTFASPAFGLHHMIDIRWSHRWTLYQWAVPINMHPLCLTNTAIVQQNRNV